MPLSVSNTVTDDSGRELLDYGTADFPIAFYDDNLDYIAVPWHWHPEFELVLVIEGQERVHAGGKTIEVDAGDAYFINGGVLHAADPLKKATIQHVMVFNSYVLGDEKSVYYEKYLSPLMKDESRSLLHLRKEILWQSEAIRHIASAWNAGSQDQPGCEFTVRNDLSALIWLILSHDHQKQNNQPPVPRRDLDRMKQMISYLEEHIAESVTLEQIAGYMNLSVSEILRCFRRTVDQTPIQFLKRMRVNKACELLISTDFPVNEIAAACGFQDMSYFSGEFRKQKGVTPSSFRKNSRE